jgi:hypothetical protein
MVEMRQRGSADRWRARVGLSALISVAVFAVPVLIAIATATEFARIVPAPRSGVGAVGWWALLLAASWIVYTAVSRVGRRALPLAALLKMTLVFPDKAPSRMAVARKAGSTRGLERQLATSRVSGIQDEPAVAAEQILALAASLNKHDRLTRGHSERVRVVTDLIADQLKLPQSDRDRLRWSALLHDIGKLTVASSILNKPGKPDEMEWQILQGHPLEGARLAAPLAGWLGSWADSIAQHHEKYDGTGYPFGLVGDQISLGGRIVAVADCYETMTAVRSYKSAMSAETARKELAACAGQHFDPVVVRAFLEASVGRVRLLGGPLSWLGEIPLINALPRLGQLASATGQAFAGAVAVAGISVAAATGVHHLPPHPSPQVLTLVPGSKAQANPPSAAPSAKTPAAGSTSTPDDSTPLAKTPATPTIAPLAGGDSGGATPGAAEIPGPSVPSAPSAPSGVLTPAAVPSAPGAPSGVAGDAEVTLSWTAPSNDGGDAVTGYAVTPFIGAAAQGTTTFNSPLTTETVSGLTDGTAYTFTVTAINDVGASVPSAPSGVLTPAVNPPTAVMTDPDCTAIVLLPQVTVNWTLSTSPTVTSYVVLRGSSASTLSTLTTISSATATSYTDTTVSGIGTTYWYAVEAVAPSGTAESGAVSATTSPLCL